MGGTLLSHTWSGKQQSVSRWYPVIYESPTNWGSIFPDAPPVHGSTGFPCMVMHSVHCLILDRAIQVIALFLWLLLKLSSKTLATWCQELTHGKRPWCWERLRAGGEGDDRGWDGWMASLIQWTWVWTNSRRWWIGKPGVLQPMGL